MRRALLAATMMSMLPQLACDGQIGTPGSSPAPTDGSGPTPPGTGPGDPGPGDPGPGAAPEETPSPAPRLFRLTHTQWDRAVRELLQLTDAEPTYVENLPNDPAQGGFIFDNNALSLSVDSTLWGAYQRTATRLAEDATATGARLGRLVPASTDADDVRARRFIEAFGLRAHRRPLTTAEVDEYFAVYTAGRTLYPDMAPLDAGIRLTIEAFLQSPLFVYRVEQTDAVASGVIPLDGFEIAARLSFFLWNSMPDDALLTAAGSGALTTAAQIQSQATRMLADSRAEDVVASFHDALLLVGRYGSIEPSAAFFPDAPDDLSSLVDRENDLFVRAMFREDRGWRDMLTTTETFVNDDLAQLYGLSGDFGDQFVRATLPANERRGLFTHIGFLAANATSVNPDPIHRGVFLSIHIACNLVAAPPDDLPPLPATNGRTNRETVAMHTEAPGSNCAACHTTLINPFGWPFESFDAIGQYRTEDNGYPVETSATMSIQGQMVSVDNALDMADTLASSDAVHECYAEHWVEYALGRPLAEEDAGLVDALKTVSLGGGSVKALLARLVQSPAFLARSTEELQ